MQRKANKQLHVVQVVFVLFFVWVHNTTQGQRTCTQDQVCKAHALSSTSHRGETGVKRSDHRRLVGFRERLWNCMSPASECRRDQFHHWFQRLCHVPPVILTPFSSTPDIGHRTFGLLSPSDNFVLSLANSVFELARLPACTCSTPCLPADFSSRCDTARHWYVWQRLATS